MLSIGLYEMCADGIAYQFLWPNMPNWNQHAIGYSMYVVAVSALLFTRDLLNVRDRSKKLDNLLLGMLGARTIFFLACIFINSNWFNYKVVEFFTLAVVFYVGISIRLQGYRPARFYVLGYSFLFLGFIVKILIHFNVSWIPFGPVTHYFLSFCFLVEMICLSFAIGDKVRMLNKEMHLAQEETINQLTINQQLKDELNNELESKVEQKTHQLIEKSEFIEKQNIELLAANEKLHVQAEEIARINKLLESDNVALKTDVAKVTEARIMSKDVDFEEFSKMYPDKESCFRFLAEVKWPESYVCRRCGHTHHCNGHSPYSRRCTKCSYDESVTAYTILQNTRIDITKAFYMIFLIYSSKGKISSHKLSEILDIRQSTCWAYSSKIKKVMKEKKKAGTLHESDGWSTLIMDEELEFSQAASTEVAEV
ncbi:7TM diverse intracellular signaling [compost metagenome]